MSNNNNIKQPITINRVTKIFGKTKVLDGLYTNIKQGDFVSIVGRSGCGKSTLLRLLAYLDTPTYGDIITDVNPTKDIRLMFQESRLLPWKNIINNIGLGLEGQWRSKAMEVLEDVGLKNKANDWPLGLSGGQKQRVALARALIHQPKILLLDEPLGALDALTRKEMQNLIIRLWKKYSFTVILVTHDINEAVSTSNRILLLENGKIDLDIDINIQRPRTDLIEIARIEQIVIDKIMSLKEKDHILLTM